MAVSHDALQNQSSSETGRRHTEVLDQHLASLGNILVLCNESPAVLERLPGRRVEQANAVVVAEASLLRNQFLDILNRGVGGHVDGWRELLDGLLGSYGKPNGN